MSTTSILSRPVIDSILATARQNLERYGSLLPVLFMRPVHGARVMTRLDLPKTSVEKCAYFAQIGLAFRREHGPIAEAVFVSEGWFVDAKEAPAAASVAPSRHPCRQEAVVVIGRDAGNTRTSHVVQPFTRDAANAPVWQPQPIAEYDKPATTGLRMQGLLDYLFLDLKGNDAPSRTANGSGQRRN